MEGGPSKFDTCLNLEREDIEGLYKWLNPVPTLAAERKMYSTLRGAEGMEEGQEKADAQFHKICNLPNRTALSGVVTRE